MSDRYVIFGAGFNGEKAVAQYGEENVICFIDNSIEKEGRTLCGKQIFLPSHLKDISEEYQVVVASIFVDSMVKQLKGLGIENFVIYTPKTHGYYDSETLVVNPYERIKEASSEEEWISSDKQGYTRQAVNDEVEVLYKQQPLFDHIEIETINRCNGSCSFCPVNHKDDSRVKAVMTEELFKNIVAQLEEIHYSGRFTTFSNNEPLLDDRIVEWNHYARKHLPYARMHLFTNGTLLTIDKFVALMEVLDELIIDNYQQEQKLIKPCEKIVEYCEGHPELKSKVTIVLRKPYEIRTTRGGNAPNRTSKAEYPDDRCALPFRQIIVRPTGEISLCCNDALGQYTLGDLRKEGLLDIWYGPRFQMVRKCLYNGRKNWGNCKFCDTFSVG